MKDDATPPAKDLDRSKRIYVLWGVGFAFLAALGAFCWLVVGPVMEVGRAIGARNFSYNTDFRGEEPLLERLGGQERAAHKLAIYMKAPRWIHGKVGGSRESAAALMGRCGKWGLVRIIPMLESSDEEIWMDGFLGMSAFFRVTHPMGGLRNPDRVLDGLDPETRELAEKALDTYRRLPNF